METMETLTSIRDRYLDAVRPTVKEITVDGYEAMLNRVIAGIGDMPVDMISQQEIDRFAADKPGRGTAKELNCLRSALRCTGHSVEWMTPRILKGIRKHSRRVPSDHELSILIRELPASITTGIALALLLGLRDAEVRRASCENYDPGLGLYRIPATERKTDTHHILPVVGTLKSILESSSGGRLVPIGKGSVESALKKACRANHIPLWYGFQPARRILVSWLVEAGYPHDQIALVTGHQINTMVANYMDSIRWSGLLDLKRQLLESVEQRFARLS